MACPRAGFNSAKDKYNRRELALSLAAVMLLIRYSGTIGRCCQRMTAAALYTVLRWARSVNKSDFYPNGMKSFACVVRDRRPADNPFAHLSSGDLRPDHRYERPTLAKPRLAAVLRAAAGSVWTLRGLTGRDGHTACLGTTTTRKGVSPTATTRRGG